MGSLHFFSPDELFTKTSRLLDEDGELARSSSSIARLPCVRATASDLDIQVHADILPISRPYQASPCGRRSLHVCIDR